MSNVQKLHDDVKTLTSNIDLVLSKAKELDKKLLWTIDKLEYSQKILTDLKKLDKALDTVTLLLKVASCIPEIKTETNLMLEDIKAIRKPLSEAEKNIQAFDNKIAPIREKLVAFEKKLKAFIDKTEEFKAELSNFSSELSETENCINSLPNGEVKNQLSDALEKFAGECDQYIVMVNGMIDKTIEEINAIENIIENKIKPLIESFETIENEVQKLEKELEGIIEPLQEIRKFLDKSFSVSFPYPCWKTWHPDICHYTLKVSASIIVQGVSAIEDYIEKILSKTLWKALKVFGLEKAIKSLVSQFKSGLKDILKRLNLNFKVTIPGLDRLSSELENLITASSDILKLLINFDPLLKELNNLKKEYDNVKQIFENCSNSL